MTKEERWKHIEILSDIRAMYSCFDDSEEPYYRALSAGIKALKQEPCIPTRDLSEEELKHFAEEMEKARPQVVKQEPCDDCISRQAAIEIARSNIHYGLDKEDEYARELLQKTMAEINSLPPVTPQPKTGHWIANAPQYDMLNPQYICSECGNAHTRITPYCEMCGAKMESEEV